MTPSIMVRFSHMRRSRSITSSRSPITMGKLSSAIKQIRSHLLVNNS